MNIDYYSPICRYITMPLWAKWEKSLYLRHLRELRLFQYLDEEEIREIQFQKTKKLLNHVYDNTSFYRRFYFDHGIHPNDIKNWDDFSKLPILTKTHIREHSEKMMADNIPEDKLVSGMTSGSTGKPLHFYSDEEGSQHERAGIHLIKEWAGHRMGNRVFSLFGQSTSEIKNHHFRKTLRRKLLNRSFNLSTLTLTNDSMDHFYRELKKTQKPFIYGYAHALFLLAEFLEKSHCLDVNAGGILSGGMVLYDYQRDKIERVFNCKVTNNYGSEEFGVIACECENHDGLHINSAAKYVELVDDSGCLVEHGKMGHVIITSLTNYGMPFIRYRIEDMARSTSRKCACGRGYPLLERLEGRESDFVITPERNMVSGISLTDNFGAKIPGIAQLQIIQDRHDHLILKAVKDQSFNSMSESITSELSRKFFGENMHYTYEFVDAIPIGPAGKVRFVISELYRGGDPCWQ